MVNAVVPVQKTFMFRHPTRLVFGIGVLNKMHEYPMPGKKAMICIDKDPFTRKLGYLDRVENELKLAGCTFEVFDKIEPNPVVSTVYECAELVKETGCDFIVSLGGGATLDSAKAISISATHPNKFWDYIGGRSGGGLPLPPNCESLTLPIIAIGTTAGTGSECDLGMVISNDETGEKAVLKHPGCYPYYCFEDPELMVSVPPRLTAFQGYDAMSHCLEGYLMSRSTLYSDVFTLAAVENCVRFLPRAVRNGHDMEARERICFTVPLSSWCMNLAGSSTMHPLEHVLSEYNRKLHHGCGLIMLSQAYYTQQVKMHTCDDRFVELARAFGVAEATRPEQFLAAHADFLKQIGCDDLKMSDYGITPEVFPQLIKNVRASYAAAFTSQDRVPLTDDDIMKILMDSYK